MADSAVNWNMDADPSKVIAAQEKVIAKHEEMLRKIQQGSKESRKATDETTEGFQMVGTAVWGVGTALVGSLGITAGLKEVIALSREWETNTLAAGRAANQAANEYMVLAQLQQGGEARARVLQVGKMAAARNITDTAGAYDVARKIQAQMHGDWNAAMPAVGQAFRLADVGRVPLPEAGAAVSAGVAFNLTPEMAGNLPFAAGRVSGAGAAQMAGIGAAMREFIGTKQGPAEAYGIAAALSGKFGPGELQSATRMVGATLGERKSKFGRVLGQLPGAAEGDIWALLGGLRERGIVTPEALERAGVTGTREQEPILALLSDLKAAQATAERVRALAAEPNLMETIRAGAEVGFPELLAARQSQAIRAQSFRLAGLPAEPDMTDQGKVIRAQALAEAAHIYKMGGMLGEGQTELGRRSWGWKRRFKDLTPEIQVATYGRPAWGVPSMEAAAGMIERAMPEQQGPLADALEETVNAALAAHFTGMNARLDAAVQALNTIAAQQARPAAAREEPVR